MTMIVKVMERLNLYVYCWTIFLTANLVSLLLFQPEELLETPKLTADLILMVFLYSCVVIPLLEELLFRKFAFWLFRTLSDEWELLLSSLVFAAAHHEPEKIIPTFCLGLMLGRIYLDSRSVGTCYLLHATTNLVDGLLVMLFPVPIIAGLMLWVIIVQLSAMAMRKSRRNDYE